MATLFFSREGNDSDRAKPIQDLSISVVSKFFSPHKYHYWQIPPIINANPESSPLVERTLVILEINSDEINNIFPYAGFYHFYDLSPADCQPLLNREP